MSSDDVRAAMRVLARHSFAGVDSDELKEILLSVGSEIAAREFGSDGEISHTRVRVDATIGDGKKRRLAEYPGYTNNSGVSTYTSPHGYLWDPELGVWRDYEKKFSSRSQVTSPGGRARREPSFCSTCGVIGGRCPCQYRCETCGVRRSSSSLCECSG